MANFVEIFNESKKHKTILFTMHGELGWDIIRWAPFVRWYSEVFKDKTILCLNYIDRIDLYNGFVDKFYSITYDYQNLRQNCYKLEKLTQEEFDKDIARIKKEYPNTFVFSSKDLPCRINLIQENMYKRIFTPRPSNREVISTILSNVDPTKKIISISSRNRLDVEKRNWGILNWKRLFELIYESKQYHCFIIGKTPSYVRSDIIDNEIFTHIEDYVTKDTSLIGLSIEALKHSCLCVGTQSSIPLLSLNLRIPALMWGADKDRHVNVDNHNKTKCVFLDDPDFNLNPQTVFNSIKDNTKIQNNNPSQSSRKTVYIRERDSEFKIKNDSKNKSDSKKKLLMIGVFDKPISNNIRLADAFERHDEILEVIRYDYRTALSTGANRMIEDLKVLSDKSDLAIICKGSGIHERVIKYLTSRIPAMSWFMDAHVMLQKSNEIKTWSKYCSWVGATGYDTAKLWERDCGYKVHMILDGTNPKEYYKENREKINDVCFIGASTEERRTIKDFLDKCKFKVDFQGPGFTKFNGPDDFRRVINESKITLNLSRGKYEGYSSVRFWHLFGCGTFVLTKFIPNMTKHYKIEDKIHTDSFKNLIELRNQINYYLEHEKEREDIALRGHEFTYANRTWFNTACDMLQIINGG